jgi:hypothetical protein
MAAIWNALPGTAPVAKFKDRNTAVQPTDCAGAGKS